ncbi:hypothetical protein DV735_g2840, partial [Chaetothyriales sp. CBS 134920]
MGPTSATDVGVMYDQHTSLLADVMGGYIHVGYWENPAEDVHVATERMTKEVAKRLLAVPGQRVLDVGCGTGKPAAQIAATYDVHITGITISNHQIQVAKDAYSTNIKSGKLDFQFANAMELHFPDTSFDSAFAIESLVHMNDKHKALTNIARVIRPGGRFVIADLVLDAGCPNREVLNGWHEMFQVPTAMPSGDDLKQLLRQTGFRIIEYTDVRDNIRPICKFLEKKALSLSGEIGERLLNVANSLAAVKELGYVFLTAERL